jgi:hypothetical protein
MKTIYGKATMTVSELREKLNEYPQDMAVFATWEGVSAPITADNFSTIQPIGGEEHLEIDVENY